jgi:hypothetical protein
MHPRTEGSEKGEGFRQRKNPELSFLSGFAWYQLMKPVKVRKCYCVCLTVDFVSLFLLCRQQYNQRVLNNLWRTRLSLRRMLCLSPVRKLDGRHTGRPKKGDNLLLGEGEQRGGGHSRRRRESLVLYKSFSTLWVQKWVYINHLQLKTGKNKLQKLLQKVSDGNRSLYIIHVHFLICI